MDQGLHGRSCFRDNVFFCFCLFKVKILAASILNWMHYIYMHVAAVIPVLGAEVGLKLFSLYICPRIVLAFFYDMQHKVATAKFLFSCSTKQVPISSPVIIGLVRLHMLLLSLYVFACTSCSSSDLPFILCCY